MNNYKPYFNTTLNKHFPKNAGMLINAIDEHYQSIKPDIAFAKTSNNPVDRRLDFTAYFLALIKTLDDNGERFESIREICLEVVTEYVRPKNRVEHFLKQLPVKLIDTYFARILLKRFSKRVVRSHPDGFDAIIITEKDQTFGLGYGIDILECGICKLFTKHHCQQYTSILCEVDEITSGLAGLTLVRSGTIALGAKKCDFRFKKQQAN